MTVLTYVAYLVISISLTVWVARTLFRNGRAFLAEVFGGDVAVADGVNQLLLVGFYLVNLGYISLALRLGYAVTTVQGAIEALSWKVGLVLLVLGLMHFFNLFVFNRMRRSRGKVPALWATES